MSRSGQGRRAGRLALAGVAAITLGCRTWPAPVAFDAPMPPWREGDRFAVVGDTQRTSWLEFWRESNDAERARVLEAIAEARPAFLVMTGDLVFNGASAAHWAELDRLAAPLHAARTPAFAALGNHEYWGGASGPERFFARFPLLEKRRHYAVAHGPLRFVVLDSNEDEMSAEAWEAQRAWYAATLAGFDRDPAVRGVLVIAHHAPYTNSTVTGDDAAAQRDLAPPFLAARKTLAMLDGHVHSYERFLRGGKTFVVSGGGGGPRAALDVRPGRRHPDDLYPKPDEALRPFHFTLFTIGAAGLDATVMGSPKGGAAFAAMDRFSLPWAAE